MIVSAAGFYRVSLRGPHIPMLAMRSERLTLLRSYGDSAVPSGEPLGGELDVEIDERHEQELLERWIQFYPGRPAPDEARLEEYGVPVWALIGYLPAVGGDIALVAQDYRLPLEAVQAALVYYRRQKGAIDAKLAVNAAYSA